MELAKESQLPPGRRVSFPRASEVRKKRLTYGEPRPWFAGLETAFGFSGAASRNHEEDRVIFSSNGFSAAVICPKGAALEQSPVSIIARPIDVSYLKSKPVTGELIRRCSPPCESEASLTF
jgi:hypothetical protein